MSLLRLAAFVLPFGFCGSLATHAQDLSDAELLRLFEAQRDAFRAARESGLGATRGLTLVTVEDVAAPAPAVDAAGPVVAAGQVGAPPSDSEVALPRAAATETAPGTADPPLIPLAEVTVAGEATGSAAGPAAGEATATPVVFGKLAPEMQVNVRITFDFDSAALRSDQKDRLTQLCTVMKASDIALFRIVGHTDASGSDDYNERLSRLRAEEVQRYFIAECGIAPGRLEAIGLGERFLFDKDDPRAAENRRVEFQALS